MATILRTEAGRRGRRTEPNGVMKVRLEVRVIVAMMYLRVALPPQLEAWSNR